MNSRRPSPVASTNGREPFVTTPADSIDTTGSPAARSAAAIPSVADGRSGTPKATSTAAPRVTPEANVITSSACRAVPVISRAAATAASAIQQVLARRQGRLSRGAAATVTATAAASTGGSGKRRAGQPRAMPGGCHYRVRMLVAGQVQDAAQRGACRDGPGRQACQQAEPAVPQGHGDGPGSRGHEAHLHQARQQPSGRV